MPSRLLKKYLPISYATKYSGYNSDYLTQLCRSGKLLCSQISKVWFLDVDALLDYLKNNDKYPDSNINSDWIVGINPKISGANSFFIEGREYVDTYTASKLTSYNRDYITQLARKREIRAKKLGKVWFVDRLDLIEFRNDLKKTKRGTVSNHNANNAMFSYAHEDLSETLPNIDKSRRVAINKNQKKHIKPHIHNTIDLQAVDRNSSKIKRTQEISSKSPHDTGLLQSYNAKSNMADNQGELNIPNETSDGVTNYSVINPDSSIIKVTDVSISKKEYIKVGGDNTFVAENMQGSAPRSHSKKYYFSY